MGRARFLLCTGFISRRSIFFVGDQTQTSTRPNRDVTFNHATCDVYSPKAVKTLMYGKCYGYCFLYCVENIFSFGFMEALDSKLTLNTIKGITSAMECADVAGFTFAT